MVSFGSERLALKGRENRFWSVMALFYERFFQSFPPYQKLVKDILHELNGVHGSRRVLDAGCGPGLLSIEMARHGHTVLGIDRSAEMLRRAEKKRKAENLNNLCFMKGDLNFPLNIPGEGFKQIFFIHSFYLLQNPEEVLGRLSRGLAPGCGMIMCNPCRRLSFGELWRGGLSFFHEGIREKFLFSGFSKLAIALMMGTLNLIIQRRKRNVYHCWNEEEISEILRQSGFKINWRRKSCLADSHILICATKER